MSEDVSILQFAVKTVLAAVPGGFLEGQSSGHKSFVTFSSAKRLRAKTTERVKKRVPIILLRGCVDWLDKIVEKKHRLSMSAL